MSKSQGSIKYILACVHDRINGWMDEWVDGWWIDGHWMGGWLGGQVDRWVDERMDGWLDGHDGWPKSQNICLESVLIFVSTHMYWTLTSWQVNFPNQKRQETKKQNPRLLLPGVKCEHKYCEVNLKCVRFPKILKPLYFIK